MINYIEKGEGLHKAIISAGHFLYKESGVWYSSNDAAVQSIIDSYDNLQDEIENAKVRIKEYALHLIGNLFPAINSIDELELIKELWSSILPAARNPTSKLASAISIYATAKASISSVAALTSVQDAKDYNAETDPGWP